jgi:hypothetical protein
MYYDDQDKSGASTAERLPLDFRTELRFMASLMSTFVFCQRWMEGDYPTAAGMVPLVMDLKSYINGNRFSIMSIGESDETNEFERSQLPPISQIYLSNLRYWEIGISCFQVAHI